ncbi:GIN domain-containing protein [Hyphomonas sp.]|uniref:GIN domain-containing protein n=1 Tax=Hyphomonas sp. TaxID=87 RepID=UPI00352878D9
MKRPATCFAALLILATPAALAETKSYPAQPFSEIEAGGPIDVIYERAATPSIVVEQAENDFSDIYLDFDGDTLIVSRNSVRNRSGWFNKVSINTKNDRKIIKVNGKRVPYYIVRVSGPDLDGVEVKKSAKLTANGVESGSFKGHASSSGDLELNGSATEAELHASSSGDILAAGFRAESLDIQISSSGDVEATSSGTGLVQVEASSSGDLELNSLGAAEFLIQTSSSADLELKGQCASIKVEASSSADVDANDLTCRSADVTASSSADVSVTATDSIVARATSSGDIYVSGSPVHRDITRSSGGDIDFGS